VRALPERIASEINFPRLIGYRYELANERLSATFNHDSRMAISTADVPTKTEMASVIGEAEMHELYGLKERREQEIDFRLASLLLERSFQDAEGLPKPWLFPDLLAIVHRWRLECLTCKDDTFPQMLLLTRLAHHAGEKIYQAIVASRTGAQTLRPILRPFDPIGSTRFVDFDTMRDVYRTDPGKCQIEYVVLDSGWEGKMAEALEEMEEVVSYAKNLNLGFTVPYTFDGAERAYFPDYLVRLDDGHGPDDLLNLIIEVSGEARKDKAAKAAAARTLWVPAVNNHGGFGRWMFIEITDPWDAKNTIRGSLLG
jgi:type III restriction enzyme